MTLRSFNLTVVGLTALLGFTAAPGSTLAGQAAGGGSAESKFKSMDTNNDGKLSREEFEEGADRRFEVIDINDDDQVTVAEMEVAREKMVGKKGKPYGAMELTSTEKVQKLDTNGDGMLSEDEYEAGAVVIFEAMDANSDGFVTKAEMEAGHKKMMEKKPGKTAK